MTHWHKTSSSGSCCRQNKQHLIATPQEELVQSTKGWERHFRQESNGTWQMEKKFYSKHPPLWMATYSSETSISYPPHASRKRREFILSMSLIREWAQVVLPLPLPLLSLRISLGKRYLEEAHDLQSFLRTQSTQRVPCKSSFQHSGLAAQIEVKFLLGESRLGSPHSLKYKPRSSQYADQ